MQKKIFLLASLLSSGIVCSAQDTAVTHTLNYDPDAFKIIPDKVFEFGIPLLFLFLLLNTIVTVLKNRAEHQLRLRLLEKEVSEDTLVKIFKESNVMAKFQPLKWFLFCLATAIALAVIHFSRGYLINQSGYLATGIFLAFLSVAFFIYYNILSKRV